MRQWNQTSSPCVLAAWLDRGGNNEAMENDMIGKKEAILEELKRTPNATTPDIRNRLLGRGIMVSANYIYTLRTTPADYTQPAPAAAPARAAAVSLDELLTVNRIVQEIGADDTRRLVAALS